MNNFFDSEEQEFDLNPDDFEESFNPFFEDKKQKSNFFKVNKKEDKQIISKIKKNKKKSGGVVSNTFDKNLKKESKIDSSPVVSIKNVVKKYGVKTVLDKLSFDINKGDIFGLLGSNGAGKSTIIKIILGLETPSSGKIKYFGNQKINLTKTFSFVPQNLAFYKDFSVKRNMNFFASISNLKGSAKKQRVKFLLDWLNLSEFENIKSGFLSGGYQRLLNIAIALLKDPQIIFLDEPTVGLDPKMRKLFWEKIKELKQAGKTIILTTHYMDEAENLCSKIVLLKKGQLLVIGKPHELIRKYGGIKVMIFEISGGISDEDLSKIKTVLNQSAVFSKGPLLFIPLEQEHGLEKTMAVTQWLSNKGYDIKSSTTKEPTLEDVFMNITGEAMVNEK